MRAAIAFFALAMFGCTPHVPRGVIACERDSDCPPHLICDRKSGAAQAYCDDKRTSSQRDATIGSTPASGFDATPLVSGTDAAADAAREAGEPEGGTALNEAGMKSPEVGTRDGGTTAHDAGVDAVTAPDDVPPLPLGFTGLGNRRTSGALVLYDEAFETGVRRCSANGHVCVTGGIGP